MRIVDRTLAHQLVLLILFCLLLFTLIWLAPETLFKLIQAVAGGTIPPLDALRIFFLNVPAVLEQTLPMAALLGTLFLFRRLSLNSELVALWASGISPARLLAPVAAVALCFSLLQIGVQELVIPKTGPLLTTLSRRYGLETEQDRPFTFVEKNKTGQMDKFFLVGNTAFGRLADFVILYFQSDPQGRITISRILVATKGQWDPDNRVWRLKSGMSYELNPEGVYRDVQRFSEQWVATSQYPYKLLQYSHTKPTDMSWNTLAQYIRLSKSGGQMQDIRFYTVRIWHKLAFPLATLAFAVFGALLGVERARASKNLGLTLAAVVLFLYSISVHFFSNLGRMGLLFPAVAAFMPLLLAIGLMALLIQARRSEG